MNVGATGIGTTGVIHEYGNVGSSGIVTPSGVWTPASLTNLLWWYNLYDLSKMWTTSAKTTNVAADGDPVGYIEDSSGNGHHIQQTTAGKRPIFKTNGTLNWLEGTGVAGAKGLVSVNTINMTATNTATICAGVTRDVNSAHWICEDSANATTTNGAAILYSGAFDQHRFGQKGTGTFREIATAAIASPNTCILVGRGTIGGTYSIRANQVETSANTSSGAGNFGNHTLYVMSRADSGLNWDGNIYTLFRYSDIKTGADLIAIETYLAEKSGVTL